MVVFYKVKVKKIVDYFRNLDSIERTILFASILYGLLLLIAILTIIGAYVMMSSNF